MVSRSRREESSLQPLQENLDVINKSLRDHHYRCRFFVDLRDVRLRIDSNILVITSMHLFGHMTLPRVYVSFILLKSWP